MVVRVTVCLSACTHACVGIRAHMCGSVLSASKNLVCVWVHTHIYDTHAAASSALQVLCDEAPRASLKAASLGTT